ncbi:MAG: hypothetical protein AAF978_09975, partial [Cyanobacteria bacterium P01_E01_bin.48]
QTPTLSGSNHLAARPSARHGLGSMLLLSANSAHYVLHSEAGAFSSSKRVRRTPDFSAYGQQLAQAKLMASLWRATA